MAFNKLSVDAVDVKDKRVLMRWGNARFFLSSTILSNILISGWISTSHWTVVLSPATRGTLLIHQTNFTGAQDRERILKNFFPQDSGGHPHNHPRSGERCPLCGPHESPGETGRPASRQVLSLSSGSGAPEAAGQRRHLSPGLHWGRGGSGLLCSSSRSVFIFF